MENSIPTQLFYTVLKCEKEHEDILINHEVTIRQLTNHLRSHTKDTKKSSDFRTFSRPWENAKSFSVCINWLHKWMVSYFPNMEQQSNPDI
jgi:hypothetical protein